MLKGTCDPIGRVAAAGPIMQRPARVLHRLCRSSRWEFRLAHGSVSGGIPVSMFEANDDILAEFGMLVGIMSANVTVAES